jgi:hypothetical protein
VKEFVQGVNPKNLALTRGVIKVCGYYIYPVEMVLIPADTLAGVPSNPGAGTVMMTLLLLCRLKLTKCSESILKGIAFLYALGVYISLGFEL